MRVEYNDAEIQIWTIKRILSEQLNSRLEEMENWYKEKGLYIPLEKIQRYYFGDPPQPPLQELPAVSVFLGNTKVEERGLFGITNDVNTIFVKCYLMQNLNSEIEGHKFFEVLYIKVLRYTKAIRQVLMKKENRNLGDSIEYLNIPSITYSEVSTFENVALKWCRLEVETIGKKRNESEV